MQESHSCRQLSDKRFDVTHETFERSSTQQRLVLRALEELIGSHSDSSGPLRILSVGCGSGILDNQLISSIALSSRCFNYTGVDPNPVACQRFRESFDKLALKNVELKLKVQGIESLDINEPFDI